MTTILNSAVYHADCLTLLERLPDHSVKVAYLDPPVVADTGPGFTLDDYQTLLDVSIKQLHRILDDEGSIFIQTDLKNANHVRPYLNKHFGVEHLLDEIQLNQTKRKFREVILKYGRSSTTVNNKIFRPITRDEALKKGFKQDKDGHLYRLVSLTVGSERPARSFEFKGYTPTGSWRYSLERLKELDDQGFIFVSSSGVPRLKQYLTDDAHLDVTQIWDDVPQQVAKRSSEFTGFETQRPLELLKRVIETASNPDDFVLDPFFGSGTALIAAHELGRQWIGCDNAMPAYTKALQRLQKECGLEADVDFIAQGSDYLRIQYPVIQSSTFRRFFISYSRKDAEEFVTPFCDELIQKYLAVWRDQTDIKIGTDWQAELQKALSKCEGMILFLSPDALNSPYVQQEINTFREAGKPIYPILCRETYIPPELERIQRVTFSERHRLISQLKSMD